MQEEMEEEEEEKEVAARSVLRGIAPWSVGRGRGRKSEEQRVERSTAAAVEAAAMAWRARFFR